MPAFSVAPVAMPSMIKRLIVYHQQSMINKKTIRTKHISSGSSSSLEMIESMDWLEREIFDFPMQRKYNCFYGAT